MGASEEVAEGMNSAFEQDVAVGEGHLEHAHAWDVVVLPAASAGGAVIVDKIDDQSQHGLQGAAAAAEAANLDSWAGFVEDAAGAGAEAEAEAGPVAELVNEVELEEQEEAGAVVGAAGNDAADTEEFAHVADEAELEEMAEPEAEDGPGLLGNFAKEFERVVAP